MLNPHHVEAMVHERQRELRQTAATVHRGAAARRRSRATTPVSRRNGLSQWLSQFAAWRRPRRQTIARPSTAAALTSGTGDGGASSDRPAPANDDRTGALAA